MTKLTRTNKAIIKKYFVKRISKCEFQCKFCGEDVFEGCIGIAPEKDLYSHFWNKHREIIYIIINANKGDQDALFLLEKLKKKYGGD